MTTAIRNIAKSMVSEIESIKEAAIISKIIEAIEFIALLSLPILLPFIIMYLALLSY
tara:strand:- start:550 stop:720 length:171 start_codon:yes stop_codon:yes gene_type:complete